MPSATLKKIPTDQLRLGMHLHALGGDWLEHPFWKTRFVLKDPADLQRLRDSPVRECWIDTARGLDVEPPDAAPQAAAEAAAPSASPPAPPLPPTLPARPASAGPSPAPPAPHNMLRRSN